MKDPFNLLPADGAEWDKAWEAVNRLAHSRDELSRSATESRGVTESEGDPTGVSEELPAADVREQPGVSRRHVSVWILIGTLWVSIGLITFAAIVAIDFFL